MAKYQTRKTKKEIHALIYSVAMVLFGNNRYKQPKFIDNAAQKDRCQVWMQMIDDGKINEAENEWITFVENGVIGNDSTSGTQMELAEIAVFLYGYINEKNDDFLEEHWYSRQEIEQGLHDIIKMLGIDLYAADLLFSDRLDEG
ncbi:MAG: DUF6483 family protein [Lachnospiraceae bacterium]|nr:DUF6483 family protein [Lachnospiraceae bacterium]